jgi:hypothetical protein
LEKERCPQSCAITNQPVNEVPKKIQTIGNKYQGATATPQYPKTTHSTLINTLDQAFRGFLRKTSLGKVLIMSLNLIWLSSSGEIRDWDDIAVMNLYFALLRSL